MSTSTAIFFASEQNSAVVRNFLTALRVPVPTEQSQPEVIPPLTTFFEVLSHNLVAFDEHCPTNIEWLGSRYISQLTAFVDDRSEKPHERLIDIFTTSYRFLCELEFSQPGQLSLELRGIQKFVDENLEKFQGHDRQQLIYANYTMPANLAKRILQHSSLADFKAFAETATSARKMKEEWDIDIAAKTIETEALQNSINRLQTKYNFVGLVNGFELLVAKKKSEADRAFKALLMLGGIMVLPVCFQLWFVLHNVETIDSHRATLVYSLPPLLALELILLYFFRIVLSTLRSSQAQLLQLDLRVSLCQFIQSYSEYSTKIKKVDASALERFEAIVFSSITSEAGNIPATFDGIEQLAKLASSLRRR